MATAHNAALVNLLATPGLGSLMARRWWAGSGQLALALAGFTLVLVWFVKVMVPYYGMMFGDSQPEPINWKILETGAILFALSWLWSLVTSISIFSEARRNAAADLLKSSPPAGLVPPKL
jgi:Mg2+/Co2+ transporter CorB